MTRGRNPKSAPRATRSKRRDGAPDPDDTGFLFTAHPTDSIDASYVLGRAFQLIGERPWHVLSVVGASLLLSGLLIFGLIKASAFSNAVWAAAGISDIMHPIALLAVLMLWWAASLVLQAPLIGSAIEVHSDRRDLFPKVLARALDVLPRLMAASFLVLIAVSVVMAIALLIQSQVIVVANMMSWNFFRVVTLGFGSLLVLYLAIKLISGVSLVVPVIVVEDLDVIAAVQRSWALGWRHGFAILWAILLPALLAELLLVPTSYMPGMVGIIASIVLSLAMSVYSSAVIPAAYVAIREYTEGLHPGRLLPSMPKSRR